MSRCIEIAKNGMGNTAPNPMVGCVIVNDSKIIGEGFTSPYGGPHAEVNAINSVKDKQLLRNSRLYVSLEPCSHFGNTPPCTDTIIDHNIPEVYIGIKDPNELVSGKGIEKLKQSGIKVTIGLLDDKCKYINRRFLTFIERKRPYIILKWAETARGYIAPEERNEREPIWISNKYSRMLTHKWRTEEQAILVGTKTVIDDNPNLTSRDFKGPNPTRIILDKNSRLPENSNVFNNDARTLIITSEDKLPRFQNNKKINSLVIDWEDQTHIAGQICNHLYENNITSVIVEGGSRTLKTFIDESIWDEARIFESGSNICEGLKAPELQGELIESINIETDTLRTYINNQPN